jgi:hypothetical protein
VFSWIGAVGYAGVRTFLAIGLAIRAPRLGGQRWAVLSQATADICYGAFPIAYVSYGFRHALGAWWVPLWLFAAGWEGYWYVVELLADDEELSMFERISGPWKAAWGLFFVLPSLLAGGFVALDAIYPRAWVFGDEPPPFACAPAVLTSGDTLTLTMQTPHGGELGVFTPTGRYLYVVPLTAESRRRATGFTWRGELRLPTADARGSEAPGGPRVAIFADTGTYGFQISEPAQSGLTLGCRVRYAGTPTGTRGQRPRE